jgi:hypothetical protein
MRFEGVDSSAQGNMGVDGDSHDLKRVKPDEVQGPAGGGKSGAGGPGGAGGGACA